MSGPEFSDSIGPEGTAEVAEGLDATARTDEAHQEVGRPGSSPAPKRLGAHLSFEPTDPLRLRPPRQLNRVLGLVLVWGLLAGGAYLAGWEYYSTPAPTRTFRPDHTVFGPTGVFGLTAAVLGWAMILTGIVIYAIQRQKGSLSPGLSSRFGVHAFLCTLGGYFVMLHTGFVFTGGVSWLSWSVLAMAGSVGVGAYLLGWLPESVDGRLIAPTVLAERRQQLLQRLWGMTEVSPNRIEHLLDQEIPVGDFGAVRALEVSLRYRLRSRLRTRRLRAAVAILEVHDGAVPEAVEIVEKQAHVQSFLQLGTPFRLLAQYWRRVHIPLGLAVSAVLAVRLVMLAAGGQS